MTNFLEINIPFTGFYGSVFSSDSEIGSETDYFTKHESEWPDALRLGQGNDYTIGNALHDSFDNSAYELNVAQGYLDAFDAWTGDVLGMTRAAYYQDGKTGKRVQYRADSIGLKWSIMTRPREYNFATDRIFGFVSLATVQKLFAISKADGHATLIRLISERFTSRDGFASYYDNTIERWLAKPLRGWDHNEYGALLLAAIEVKGGDLDSLDMRIYEELGLSESVSDAIDWPRYRKTVASARAEKLAEWIESDDTAARQWAGEYPQEFAALAGAESSLWEWRNNDSADHVPAYRCDKTADMFSGVAV
jgi:hypothetical protein